MNPLISFIETTTDEFGPHVFDIWPADDFSIAEYLIEVTDRSWPAARAVMQLVVSHNSLASKHSAKYRIAFDANLQIHFDTKLENGLVQVSVEADAKQFTLKARRELIPS